MHVLQVSNIIKFLFDLILYIPVNNYSVMSGRSSWVEPVLSKDKFVLLKVTTQWHWLDSSQALYHWTTVLLNNIIELPSALS